MTNTMNPAVRVVDETDHDMKADALRSELDRRADAIVDAMVDTRALRAEPVEAPEGDNFPAQNRVALIARTPDGDMRLRLMDGGHEQMADRLDIPRKYYDRMMASAPDLLAENMNVWMQREPKPRLLRMLRPLTDHEGGLNAQIGAHLAVRAVLSERYRPLDHAQIVKGLFETLEERRLNGVRVTEWNLDERRLFVRFVGDEENVDDIIRRVLEKNPDQPTHTCNLREIIKRGITLRNSETGHASLSVAPFAEILRCINRLQVMDTYRVTHVGSGNGNGDGWREDTRRLDDAASILKVRDKFIELFSDEQIEKIAVPVAAAMDAPLALPENVPVMEFLGNVGARFELTEQEVNALRDGWTEEREQRPGVAPTRWTLSQAFTAGAKRLGDDRFDRKVEIEEIGWKVLSDPMKGLLAGKKA